MQQDRKIFTLSKLTQSLENHFLEHFAQRPIWITAEVSKMDERSGNYYIELADAVEGRVVAKMQANLWAGNFKRLNAQLGGELAQILAAGNRVLLSVIIDYSSMYGLKLVIRDVDPSIAYGEIEKKKKATIERLKAEGIYQNQKQLYLSPVNRKIALIGSPETSGMRDFLNELQNNRIYTSFQIKQFPCGVQGEKAIPEIVAALKEAACYNIDVIVLLRGGGSKMDLNVFNEYDIAKQICLSRIPVLTGIGHETDEVVADLVAKQSEITPTAVAKFIYNSIGIVSGNMIRAFDSIIKRSMELVYGKREAFNHLNKYLVHHTQLLLQNNQQQLRQAIHALELGGMDRLQRERAQLRLTMNRIGQYGKSSLDWERKTKLQMPLEMIALHAKNTVEQQRAVVQNEAEKLHLLNPLRLLERGYTMSTVDGVDLRNVEGEIEGKTLLTLTDKHLIEATITKKTTSDGK